MRSLLLCLGVVTSLVVHAKSPSREMKYILARADGTLTMAASLDDIPLAKSLQEKYGKPVLVFQQDGHLYVIVDRDVLARVEKVVAKSEPFEKQQAELSKRQERVDKQEEALSDRVERAEQEIDRANDSGDRERARQLKPQLDAAKQELRQLKPTQHELEAEERALTAKQDQIGAEVEATIREIARDALSKGTAIKVR